jgi:hypothetical protein
VANDSYFARTGGPFAAGSLSELTQEGDAIVLPVRIYEKDTLLNKATRFLNRIGFSFVKPRHPALLRTESEVCRVAEATRSDGN